MPAFLRQFALRTESSSSSTDLLRYSARFSVPAPFQSRLVLGVDEDRQVIAQQRGGQADRIRRRDRPVRPDLEDQPVVVGGLPDAGRLHVVVHAADGRMHGVDRDVADSHVVVEVLVGRDVAPPRRDPHLHLQPAVLRERRDRGLRLQDLDRGVALDVGRGDLPLALDVQRQQLLVGRVHLDRDLLQVENDVGHVLHDARQRRELVEHSLDLDCGDRRALDRREQHAPQGVTHGGAEAPLEGLGVELSVRRGQRLGVDLETLGLLKSFPEGHFSLSFVRATWSTARRSAAPGSAV
jgi:hypothetical protein